MKPLVREKLDRMAELFPPERLAASRERWRRLWAGEPVLDRYPFLAGPYQVAYFTAGQRPEERLHAFLDEFLVRGQVQDDFIPTLFPGSKLATIPTMFGALDICVGDDWTCNPIITSEEDVARLPEPSLIPGTVAHEWLTLQRYLLEETEGELPIHVTEMQGPAEVCGQLWGYGNSLACAYTDPDIFHVLMTKATDAFILLWQAQQDILGAHFIATHLLGWDWVPSGTGASLSADSMVLISADFYQEFIQPHFERIAAQFGGLTVHSCGDFSAVLPALCATPGVNALNASQMSLRQLLDAGLPPETLVIMLTDLSEVADTFRLIREQQLRVDMAIFGFWPCTENEIKPIEAWTGEDWDTLRRTEAMVTELAYGGIAVG